MSSEHKPAIEHSAGHGSGRGKPIRETVRRHRRAVNRAQLLRSLAWAATIAGAAACVAAAGFALSGSGVPASIYPAGVLLLAALGVAFWLIGRRDESQVATAIDERFGLRDGVRTACAFEREGGRGGFGVLQAGWTRDRVERADARELVDPLSKRLLAAAIALPCAALLLGLAPESEAVRAERAERAMTVALAEELNEGIEELVEEEIASADEEEAESLDPAELRELVDELEVSPEKADLLKQYAEMEQQLSRNASELESAGLERLLDEAAAQLAGSPETARLGSALEQRRLGSAARELESFKLSDEIDAEKLAEKRREIEKLSSLAKRLAEAARKRDAQRAGERGGKNGAGEREQSGGDPSSSSQSSGQSSGGSPDGERGGQSGRPGSSGEAGEAGETREDASDSETSLADEIRELEEAVEEAEKSLGECEGGQCSASDLDKLAQCSSRANSSLDRMARSMRSASKKREAQRKLRSMSRKLAECQSCVAGQCSSPFAGGKNAGSGSSDSDRLGNEAEDGVRTDISAAEMGAGPSLTTTEEADSGDGVSSRRGSATRQEFDRQLEALIERPDVPAEVKEGVKVYLENIHRTPEGEADPAPTP